MYRSWHKRIFGGVCGGLGNITPFNAGIWRIIFAVGTLLTLGAMGAVYIGWWWLLPQERPRQRPPRAGLGAVIALLWAVFVVGGFIGRYVVGGVLVTAEGVSYYEPLLALGLALILFYRQFTLPAGSRRAPLLALVLVLMASVPLMGALSLLPEGIYDLVLRASPVALIFMGVYVLIRERLPIPAGLVSALISLALVAGVTVVAFNSRELQQRTENTLTYTETLSDAVTFLQVDVETLDTDVSFFSVADDTRTVTATFTGSTESVIEEIYSEADGGIANIRIVEQRDSPYPNLEAVGRGTLRIELPTNVAIALTYGGQRGDATFDMADLDLERLTIDLAEGDALVSLPAYQPLSPSISESPGQLAIYGGDLRLVIPDEVGGRFVLNRDRAVRPVFNDTLYLLIDDGADGTLQAIGYEGLPLKLRYTLTVPRGQIRLDTVDITNADATPTTEDNGG